MPSAIPSLLDALDDPQLFALHFKGDTWARWRSFMRALFALPMNDAEAEVYRQCTGRNLLPGEPFSEAALVIGRRGGKSINLALIAVYLSCFRDYTPYLSPGEVATVAVLAANRNQARTIFRFISGLFKAVPLLAPMVEDENTEAIKLNNRVVIEINTASFRTTRGYSFAAILCDEIAFWQQDESSANPDIEILRALRPGMASIPGSVLLLASSPYAKKGELYHAYRKHYGQDGAPVLVWKADTRTMNPKIPQRVLDDAYESDPESARAEYGAEFRDDLADFLTRESVDKVTMWGRKELPRDPGVTYSAFADPSGGVSDAMALAIGHLQGNVGVLDALLEIRPPFDPDVAVRQCVELLQRFGISRVVGDHYAGQWPVARFREHGVVFEQCARPKSALYLDFLPLVNAGRLELLENSRLTAQLVGLERRTARSGRDSVDHTPGGHDDVANAVAGVLVNLDLDRRPLLAPQSALLVNNEGFVPAHANCVFAVIVIGDDGTAAVLYCAPATHWFAPLWIADFAVGPFTGSLFADVGARLDELAVTRPPKVCAPGSLGVYGDAEIVRGCRLAGVPATELAILDPRQLRISGGAHLARGDVRLSPTVLDKAATSPFRPALELRAGDDADVLQQALLIAIAVSLDDARAVQKAAA